jgi:opacity protein-like surface antigen
MKNTLIAILILSLFSVTAYSQSSSFWLGAHAGINITNLHIDPPPTASTFNSGTGFAFGAEADYWITDNIGIAAQLAYVQRDASANSTDPFAPFTSNLVFSYLQLPVLLKVTFGSGPLKPFFFAGPEFGFKLSTKETDKSSGRDTTFNVPDSEITTTNIGILIGAGISYAISPGTLLFLQGGYDYGLSNINNQFGKGGLSAADNPKASTRDIRVSLGILFRLGE